MFFFFFFNDPAPTEIYTLSLHDALPILMLELRLQLVAAHVREMRVDARRAQRLDLREGRRRRAFRVRSEEHTSELQSLRHLVCRLLLEKKKDIIRPHACGVWWNEQPDTR